MKPFGKSLALFVLSLGISTSFGKPLTEKQAQDAAARIDFLLADDLKAANVQPLGNIDDGAFLRRAYLGIIGRIPTEEESRAFLDNSSPNKRQALVDSLVNSPGFDSHLFNWTADLLRIQTNQEQFGLGWHVWLRKSLAEDKHWDVIVREMLSSTGHASKNPAVGYYLRDRNMQLDNFSNSMQVFLGRQIGCAQCHDHPFDDWTQHEYYQMAAFGGGINYRSADAQETAKRVANELSPAPEMSDRKMDKKARREANNRKNMGAGKIGKSLQPIFQDFNKNAILDDPTRSLRLPEDYQYTDAKPKDLVAPETLFGVKLTNVPADQRQATFAKWVTSRENPYFTKVIANRLWARAFGHGLLDPVDDWSEDSKPAHPQVLAFLETSMKVVDYDLRQFSRILFLTKLFQRQCDPVEAEPGVPHLVRGPSLERMTAEQIYDSMIVLNRGEIDDSPLSANSARWETYTASIEKLLSSSSKELVSLAETATHAEKAYRDAQSEGRRLRALLAETKDETERKNIAAQMRDANQKANDYRKLRDPVAMMNKDMSMAMMEEDGGGKNRRGREGAARNSARASELPAPFNPATLVRDFGGSDRTTPSAGNSQPTVPQALALLNDPTTDVIGNKRSVLSQRLASLKTPEEKLEVIFLRLYSRLPNSQEKEKFLPLAQDEKSIRDLTRAMITSNRFIFVP